MTWVKICGITNLEDALAAVEAGADALGFVFYEKSPRNVSVDKAREMVSALDGKVETVGVFVTDEEDGSTLIADEVGFSAVQIHVTNHETRQKVNRKGFKGKRYIAVPMETFLDAEGKFDSIAVTVKSARIEGPDAFFLDSGTPQQPGGTGKTFNWKAARSVANCIQDAGGKLVVAGGLTAENVGEAMSILQPWGVDVSSGVEERPGKKDAAKVRAFIKAVREADKARAT